MALFSRRKATSWKNPVLSVVSPVFCEGKGIVPFLEALYLSLASLNVSFEVILVDDGSPDDSWEHMRQAFAGRPWLRCLRLSRNFGKEAALAAGLDAARGRAVLTLDSDLQHPPSLIPRMVDLWKSGKADIVEAEKSFRQKESPLFRILVKIFFRIFARLSPFDITNASDFKLLDRTVLDAWKTLPERRMFFRGMSRWVGFQRIAVPFPPADRSHGSSKWSLLSRTILALDSLSAYSTKPLSLIWLLGGLFGFFALFVGVEALWTKLHGQAVTGFTTVILLHLISGAAILGSICLLTLYVRQMFYEIKQRPRYLIREYCGQGERRPSGRIPPGLWPAGARRSVTRSRPAPPAPGDVISSRPGKGRVKRSPPCKAGRGRTLPPVLSGKKAQTP
ncbi:MAG: glycosyltransferase [Desulfovibrio sp.]|jgi:dolichol-phosphate mannosyltransferase|nr:glycosyltransferase [Desulfovibrio sp.]